MNEKEFYKKYTNDVIAKNTLMNIYNYANLSNEKNMKDFIFLYPILNELCYYKNNYKTTIIKNYEDKETLKLITNCDDYFIYSLLDKGINIDDIINFQMKSFKKIIHKMLLEIIVTNESFYTFQNDLINKILDMQEKDMLQDEIEEEIFKPSIKLVHEFDALCKLLNL